MGLIERSSIVLPTSRRSDRVDTGVKISLRSVHKSRVWNEGKPLHYRVTLDVYHSNYKWETDLLKFLTVSCTYSADLHSLDFAYNRLFMKLFRTKTIHVVKDCQYYFGAVLPSVLVLRKADKLDLRYQYLENAICTYCRSI